MLIKVSQLENYMNIIVWLNSIIKKNKSYLKQVCAMWNKRDGCKGVLHFTQRPEYLFAT